MKNLISGVVALGIVLSGSCTIEQPISKIVIPKTTNTEKVLLATSDYDLSGAIEFTDLYYINRDSKKQKNTLLFGRGKSKILFDIDSLRFNSRLENDSIHIKPTTLHAAASFENTYAKYGVFKTKLKSIRLNEESNKLLVRLVPAFPFISFKSTHKIENTKTPMSYDKIKIKARVPIYRFTKIIDNELINMGNLAPKNSEDKLHWRGRTKIVRSGEKTITLRSSVYYKKRGWTEVGWPFNRRWITDIFSITEKVDYKINFDVRNGKLTASVNVIGVGKVRGLNFAILQSITKKTIQKEIEREIDNLVVKLNSVNLKKLTKNDLEVNADVDIQPRLSLK